MAAEHIRHWKIGDVTIARIVEVYGWEDDITMLLPDADPAFVQGFPWMRPHFATPDGKMIISFQCFVLRSQGRMAMIDTCIGNDRQREFPVFTNMQTTFLEDLAAAGFPHEEITDVLCTHLHFDHVGWNTRLVDGKWVPTFPQARYLFGRREYEHWKHLHETHGYHDLNHMDDAVMPVLEAGLVEFIEPDFRLTDEVSLIPTPGHTPGHVSVLIQSKGESAVITGDMMHSPIQIAVPEREARFDMDKSAAARTRGEFVRRFNGTPTLVIGSHFAEPTAGHIVPDGAAWKFKV
ncbi:MAG: MBL fold metallo-hydrolase [Proteobacteria bacterium]|jgi:glyoxylase-like metal-dependent hydrolase (beta-lactamase superfamily II)|nr:MBL fold metallo-hydrolase [Pseudomonadota bacterium]MBK7115633.1 MBL fold metallo-hydrolase [Pseudomonadota bacterium]MBK9250905.1 MBL fold metallo-hydrolase [Pseudomonadota bacterium]